MLSIFLCIYCHLHFSLVKYVQIVGLFFKLRYFLFLLSFENLLSFYLEVFCWICDLQIFLLVCSLSFHSFSSVFHKLKVFNFDGVLFLKYFLMNSGASVSYLKIIFLIQTLNDFFLFSSKEFMLYFTFKSMIYFSVNFSIGARYWLKFSF